MDATALSVDSLLHEIDPLAANDEQVHVALQRLAVGDTGDNERSDADATELREVSAYDCTDNDSEASGGAHNTASGGGHKKRKRKFTYIVRKVHCIAYFPCLSGHYLVRIYIITMRFCCLSS